MFPGVKSVPYRRAIAVLTKLPTLLPKIYDNLMFLKKSCIESQKCVRISYWLLYIPHVIVMIRDTWVSIYVGSVGCK